MDTSHRQQARRESPILRHKMAEKGTMAPRTQRMSVDADSLLRAMAQEYRQSRLGSEAAAAAGAVDSISTPSAVEAPAAQCSIYRSGLRISAKTVH